MKPRSLCQCINVRPHYKNLVDLKSIYTCARLVDKDEIFFHSGPILVNCIEPAIFLEEVKMIKSFLTPFGYIDVEIPFCLKDFRELLPPMEIDIEAILEKELVITN